MLAAETPQSASPIAPDAAASALVSISMRLDKKTIAKTQANERARLRAEAKVARIALKQHVKEERAPIKAAGRALTARAKAEAHEITAALKAAIIENDILVPLQFKARHERTARANQLAIQVAARDRAASGVV